MWAKIITIKRTKDLNYFSLCAFNLFNTRVSQLEFNYWNKKLFHDIHIFLDAPVYVCVWVCVCVCISVACSGVLKWGGSFFIYYITLLQLMFTLSANSYRFYLHLEGFSAIYTTYCKQWQLSAPQYCSTLIKQFAVITACNL